VNVFCGPPVWGLDPATRFLLHQKRIAVVLARRGWLVVLVFLSHALALDTPKAVLTETRFHFENVICGSVVGHDFVLQNRGSAPLRIDKVSMTSPLLVTRMPREIAPGAEDTIRFKLDTSSLEGAFQGQILVSLNDPALSEASLTFEGQVVPTIELSPMPAFFVSAQRGQAEQSSIEIINHAPEPLDIEKVEHPTDRFDTVLETLEGGRRYRLTLLLKPDGPVGRGTETVLLNTSSKTLPVLKVSANTYLHERVYTFPDAIDLGAIPIAVIRRNPGILEQIAETLMIYQENGSDFKIELSTDVPACNLRSERGPKGDRYQATVSLISDNLKAGPIIGSIFIQTNDPQFPKITVPVSGWILER
jgi:hypothetical protein